MRFFFRLFAIYFFVSMDLVFMIRILMENFCKVWVLLVGFV